ncbi:MAG: hypothetical protein JKX80_00640 [Candidatus Pacebacteria bacterium]|nr:hypothetical protein [Candidatus Paceibacterota bacterium]
MIRKIIFIVLVIIALTVLWSVFKSFRESPTSVTNTFFQTNFLSEITSLITGPLTVGSTRSPAEVDLDELGEFSPVAGMIEIVKDTDTVNVDDIFYEYVEIRANKDNAQPINISDWSLQSMISDTWIGIPQGTELYVAGEVNELQDIYLRPGESAIIATRQSPVGVSFRVNRCSGFLSDTQDFEPTLSSLCINPREVVPPTIENLKEFGDACVTFSENFQRCAYVTSNVNGFSGLSQACRERIQPRLTHNFCNGVYAKDSDFYSAKEWRIFLNQNDPLWKESYEIIRLLDENRRTVDVFNY